VNFKEIREEINSSLDYNPDLSQYRDAVSRVINRHYLQISSQYQWLFLQKSGQLTFEAKITGEAGKTITVAHASNGWRTVVFSGVTPTSSWEGQTLTIAGTEFEITEVKSANRCVIDASLAGDITASTNWSLEFRRYKLPEDCVEVLGVVSRADDRGRLLYIDRRKEEEHFLDRDDAGDPMAVIEDEHIIDPPPDNPPTLSLQSGGSLTAGTIYEVCYTYQYKGRESAPSLVAEITPAAANLTIRVSAMGDTRATYGSSPAANVTGRTKRIYAREKTRGGVWRLVADSQAEDPATTFDWLGTFASSGSDQEQYAVETLFEEGPRQYLRAWYTANSALTVDIRYMSRPRRLSNDADVPSWPTAYHHLLVYRALQDIALQSGMNQMAQIYSQRATAALEQMKARHLSRSDRMWIRQGFDKVLFQQERWGVPSKL